MSSASLALGLHSPENEGVVSVVFMGTSGSSLQNMTEENHLDLVAQVVLVTFISLVHKPETVLWGLMGVTVRELYEEEGG